MVTLFVCMFVADVFFVFIAFLAVIILALWRTMSHQYGRLGTPAPAATKSAESNSKFVVKEKATKQVFDVYDTRHEDSGVSFMIYKNNEFTWVTSSEFEPA